MVLANMLTLLDIIITDYIVTDTFFHGHNYSRSTLSGKFLIFRTVYTNFRLKELLTEDKQYKVDGLSFRLRQSFQFIELFQIRVVHQRFKNFDAAY